MTQDNDTTPKSNLLDIEERIRRFVSLFKGGHGDIKNKQLENLIKFGYTRDEAKKLYNFGENFKHLLPESNIKAPKTLKDFITKLILLAEAQPELAVALFGKDNEAILAELAVKSTADQQKKMNNMSHPGVSGRKKTIDQEAFVSEIDRLCLWFRACNNVRDEIIGILDAPLANQNSLIGKYIVFVHDFLRKMKPRDYKASEKQKNDESNNSPEQQQTDESNNSPEQQEIVGSNEFPEQQQTYENNNPLLLHAIIQHAATTNAYKYLLDVTTNKVVPKSNYNPQCWANIPAFFFQIDIFLFHIQIKILQKYFSFFDRCIIRTPGYKNLIIKSECAGFKKEDILESFDNNIRINKKIMTKEVFGLGVHIPENTIIYYNTRQRMLYELFIGLESFFHKEKDISDKQTELIFNVPEMFLVILTTLEKQQEENIEKLEGLFPNNPFIKQKYPNLFYRDSINIKTTQNVPVPYYLIAYYKFTRNDLLERNIISSPEVGRVDPIIASDNDLRVFKAQIDKIKEPLLVDGAKLAIYINAAEKHDQYKQAKTSLKIDELTNDSDLSSLEYYNLFPAFIEGQEATVSYSMDVICISLKDEKLWFRSRPCQAKKDDIMLWFDENLDVTHAKRDDGLEIWFDKAGFASKIKQPIKPSRATVVEAPVINNSESIDAEPSDVVQPEQLGDTVFQNLEMEVVPKMKKVVYKKQKVVVKEKLSPFKAILNEPTILPEFDENEVSLIKELSRTRFMIDEKITAILRRVKETFIELYPEVEKLLPILSSYGILHGNLVSDYFSQTDNDEDLSWRIIGNTESITFKGKEYLFEKGSDGKIIYIPTNGKEFWFENTEYGTKLRQGRMDDVLIWFKDSYKIAHALLGKDIELWVEGSDVHLNYYGMNYWINPERRFVRLETIDGAAKEFSYDDLGRVVQVIEPAGFKKAEKKWMFSYRGDKISKITKPDGKAISISQYGHIYSQKNAAYPFTTLLKTVCPLPEMAQDTVSLLEELSHIPLYVDDIDWLNTIKVQAEGIVLKLHSKVLQVLSLLSVYGMTKNKLADGFYSHANDDMNLYKLPYRDKRDITFLDKHYTVERHNNIVHVTTDYEDLWFENTEFGSQLIRVQKDGVLIYLKDNLKVFRIFDYSGTKVIFDEEKEEIVVFYDSYIGDLLYNRGKLTTQIKPSNNDGIKREIKYNKWGQISQVIEGKEDDTAKVWEFSYNPDDTLDLITEPDGTEITISQKIDQGPPEYTGKLHKPEIIEKNRAQGYLAKIDNLSPAISEAIMVSNELLHEAEKIAPLLKQKGLFKTIV